MNSSFLLSSTTFIYALASVFYIGSFTFKKASLSKVGFIVLVVGFLDILSDGIRACAFFQYV